MLGVEEVMTCACFAVLNLQSLKQQQILVCYQNNLETNVRPSVQKTQGVTTAKSNSLS